jgi:hypothetical protein
MDWGLFDPKAPKETPYLRNEMIYGTKWMYYAAIVQDFVLRLAWVMNVSLGEAWTLEADLLMFVTLALDETNYFIQRWGHRHRCKWGPRLAAPWRYLP